MAREKNTAFSTNAEVEIVHAVRGRVRLRFKGDYAHEILPQIAQGLRQQESILTVQIKQASSSLIVLFDPDVICLNELRDCLQAFGFSNTSAEARQQLTKKVPGITYSRLFSLIPPVVGIVVARRLQVSGWKSILTFKSTNQSLTLVIPVSYGLVITATDDVFTIWTKGYSIDR
ncbi:MAG: hypothetical protein QNJ18_11950 [Xenococcaceae cyanobacterium MO_167.B52]|nr:hypothetical protein [Xenococcaceae cyanobacterium MO_167.B52]